MSCLKLDEEDHNVFIMEVNYDESENWRDLLCFIMINDTKKVSESYELHRCTLPIELGMIDIVGVDII
jgi:hypothetical protein